MNCFCLHVFGQNCIVLDSQGSEITRREGFKEPSLFVIIFPCTVKNANFQLDGAKLISRKILPVKNVNITLPNWEKTPTIENIVKKTYIKDWHSPASINPKTGELIYNKDFLTFSDAKKDFIVFHEEGHFYYKTEKFCDLYASKKMLQKGFGMSQCLEVLRNVLSDSKEKEERYNFVLSHLKKIM